MSLDLERLPHATAERLRSVGRQRWSRGFYLAGSGALALHLGHRRPRGLDLMGADATLVSPQRRDIMQEILATDPDAEIETARDGYLDLRFADDVPVRLYHYPYPLVASIGHAGDLRVASLIDLGLMKLGAIISRSARRDFVDLHAMRHRASLESMLARAGDKFPRVRDFPLQALKGLADRDLAAAEPMPRLTTTADWPAITSWIDGEIRRLARDRFGLEADVGPVGGDDGP